MEAINSLKIYKKPKVNHNIKVSDGYITVSLSGARIYFSQKIVKEYKMLSAAPVFAIDQQGHWNILLGMTDSPDSFPLSSYNSAYFIHCNDLVNRLLLYFNEPKKVTLKLTPTKIPFVFQLDKATLQPENKKYIKQPEDALASNPFQSPAQSTNYYDTLLNTILSGTR